MHLAREGYPFVAGVILAALLVYFTVGAVWSIPFWLLVLFVLQFFREPIRRIPTDSHVVVSPADGKVVAIGDATDPISGKSAIRIAIFLNVFSVHSNRIPIAGTIVEKEYRHGKFLNAAIDKSSDENERNTIVIRTKEFGDVSCVQIAGLIARRILCYVETGDNVEMGQKYGFIRFGSRVELFLPEDFKIKASIGEYVSGGSDVIAFRSADTKTNIV